MEDPVVLSYGDSIIRLLELQSLDRPAWLTDNIISFFFEYMSTAIFSQYGHRIGFVGPDFTQLLKLCDKAELASLISSAELNVKEYIFFPINDSLSGDSPGGTHWSLLVCNLRQNWCHHYDSNGGVNETNARKLFHRLTFSLMDRRSTYEEVDCPQQNNGYDCGVHVIVNARILAKHLLMDEPLPCLDDEFDYTAMRAKLKYVICHVNECVDIL